MYRRNIESKVVSAVADTPCIFLSGPRQAGKSTLAKHLLNQGLFDVYVTLDNLNVLDSVRADPMGFINFYRDKKIVIDEIHLLVHGCRVLNNVLLLLVFQNHYWCYQWQ